METAAVMQLITLVGSYPPSPWNLIKSHPTNKYTVMVIDLNWFLYGMLS